MIRRCPSSKVTKKSYTHGGVVTCTTSLRDTPIVDKACCVLMANNEIVMDLLEAGDFERAKQVVAWLIWLAMAPPCDGRMPDQLMQAFFLKSLQFLESASELEAVANAMPAPQMKIRNELIACPFLMTNAQPVSGFLNLILARLARFFWPLPAP